MRFVSTDFSGLFVLEPERAEDERGYFSRLFCEAEFSKRHLETRFLQWSEAHNRRAGTVRGLHYQRSPYGETKLIRCIAGAVHDVIVDIRPSSPTYLRVFTMTLSAENGIGLYVAQGFAHGYQTLRDETELLYAISTEYRPEAASGLRWDDPALSIQWPLPISLIAERDRNWPLIESKGSEIPPPDAVTRP